MTREEKRLWYDFLRHYPIRFLRQKVIDRYIVDFYCKEASLVIEVDGSQHYSNSGIAYDQARTKHLQARGLTVIRIPNNAVNHEFNRVCAYIDCVVQKKCR